MKGKSQTIQEEGPKVPGYIVTFSDMVTLLLTFFVMLLSMASKQDPELFNIGRRSFTVCIQEYGMGKLLGGKPKSEHQQVKMKYQIKQPDQSYEQRTVDAREEMIRKLAQDVARSMKTRPSQLADRSTNFSVTNIRFPRGGSFLDESARRYLTQFAFDMRQNFEPGSIKLYVLGLAANEKTDKQQLTLSAKRAQAAAEFLQNTLCSKSVSGTDMHSRVSNWPVYSWGAGRGGNWVSDENPASQKSHILIAVLHRNN